jgi:hypothetical protein
MCCPCTQEFLRPLADTGSGRWAKEDAESAEQSIYDDSTFPWDDFLKQNTDRIVVDMGNKNKK